MKNLLLLLCSLCSVTLLTAQQPTGYDPAKDLPAAIRTYNELRQFCDKLTATTITDNDINTITDYVTRGTALLDPIMTKESGKVANVARYFHTVYLFEKGFMLGMKGRRKESFQLLRTIEPEMSKYSSGSFPLEYQMDDKNYVIKWDNFAPTQAEYYVSMCEFSRDEKDQAAALAYAAKANANEGALTDWLKTLSNLWTVDIKLEQKSYDRALLDAAFASLDGYHGLTEKERTSGGVVIENLPRHMADAIDFTLNTKPELSDKGTTYVKAAGLLKAENMQGYYLKFAGAAIRDGYSDRTFLSQLVTDAAAAGDKALAVKACDQYATTVTTVDCAGLATVSDLYTRAGDKVQAGKWKEKSDDCARKRDRAQRRSQRDYGLYLGTYVFPYFRSDYGFVAAIQTRKIYFEASYQAISDRRDRLSDISEASNTPTVNWDGYYTHLALNFMSKKGSRGARPYTGLLVGYNIRNFQPIQSGVYQTNSNYIGQYEFKPTETRYIAMLNSGIHAYGKFFAGDVYMSAGAGYSQFDRGNAQFSGDGYEFDHSMLGLRKAERFTLMLRVGITVGLQVGSNNRR
jgi:hypothetical protein